MIGAIDNPMSMFKPEGGGDAFQRGMMIGDANSAASPIARAFQNTLDKYNAHLSAQQDQQNKIDLLKTQYGLQGGNLISGIKEKYNQSTPHLSPEEQQIDPMHPEDKRFIRNVGGVEMYPQPIYDTYGRVKGYKYVNPRALSMMDMINGPSGGDASAAGTDTEATQTLKELQDLQASLPQGM